MDDAFPSEDALANASREEIMSALFANMVIQHTNMALMFLGKMPHPETGETLRDIESAKIFIDQLEMIEFKTKGNLDKREEGLLKQSLTALRMSFVEAIEGDQRPPSPENSSATQPSEQPPKGQPASTALPQSQPEEESRKRFTKKY